MRRPPSNVNPPPPTTHQILKLDSPSGAAPMLFPFPGVDECRNVGVEILETIRFVCEDFPSLKQVLDLTTYDPGSYDSLKGLCRTYNYVIAEILRLDLLTAAHLHRLELRATRPLLRHILQLVYDESVTDPARLNSYEPFSPGVYGETSFDLVCDIIDQIELTGEDVFIDLGSGVGQVVLQVAGLVECKVCFGVERAEVPSGYAVSMDTNFRRWMRWFGKTYTNYELVNGDFLDPSCREMITGSTIVFVNNYVFGPVVNHELKARFKDLADGTLIITSHALCPLQFRITERTRGDIGAILNMTQLESTNGNVSWTSSPVTYYGHTIDRSKLEAYFEGLKWKKRRRGVRVVERRMVVGEGGALPIKKKCSNIFSPDHDRSVVKRRKMSTNLNHENPPPTLHRLIARYKKRILSMVDGSTECDELKLSIHNQIRIERGRKSYLVNRLLGG